MKKEHSNGSTASYYEIPAGATQLQDLISDRDMNAQIGEVFRACYRYGRVSHSDKLRDAKKILFYAQAEVARLEKLQTAVSASVGAPVESAHSEKFDQGGDGWIPWNATSDSECPVDPRSRVRVRLANGNEVRGAAECYRWKIGSTNGRTVVAYFNAAVLLQGIA